MWIYSIYIIKDVGKYNGNKVDDEFKILLNYI